MVSSQIPYSPACLVDICELNALYYHTYNTFVGRYRVGESYSVMVAALSLVQEGVLGFAVY